MKLGYFSQQALDVLDPELTVLEQVQKDFPARRHRRPPRARRRLPVLRRRRGQEGPVPLGRREVAPRHGAHALRPAELPRPRRAHEPPRPRDEGDARRGALEVRGDDALRVPRPRVPARALEPRARPDARTTRPTRRTPTAARTSSGCRARGTRPPASTHNRAMSRARFAAALAVLACVALAGAERARFSLWTTSDEPAAPRGRARVAVRPRHGLELRAPGPHEGDRGRDAPGAEARDLEIDETRAGRAAIPFVLALLVLVTGLLGRALAGPSAGLAAAALLAVEPTFRGHGTLVQSDVLVTLFLVAAAFALGIRRRARERRKMARRLAESSTASRWRRSIRRSRSFSSSRRWRRFGSHRREQGKIFFEE